MIAAAKQANPAGGNPSNRVIDLRAADEY